MRREGWRIYEKKSIAAVIRQNRREEKEYKDLLNRLTASQGSGARVTVEWSSGTLTAPIF